jgi:hypothetical protein
VHQRPTLPGFAYLTHRSVCHKCAFLQAEGAGTQPRLALLHAICALYWREYLAIGAIKLLGDALNFAGPFLLQLLLRCPIGLLPSNCHLR